MGPCMPILPVGPTGSGERRELRGDAWSVAVRGAGVPIEARRTCTLGSPFAVDRLRWLGREVRDHGLDAACRSGVRDGAAGLQQARACCMTDLHWVLSALVLLGGCGLQHEPRPRPPATAAPSAEPPTDTPATRDTSAPLPCGPYLSAQCEVLEDGKCNDPGIYDAAAGPADHDSHVCLVRDGYMPQPQFGFCDAYLIRPCAVGGTVVAGIEHDPDLLADPLVDDRITVVFDAEHNYLGRVRLFPWNPEVVEASGGRCRQVYTGPKQWAQCAWSAYDDFMALLETCSHVSSTTCPDGCAADESGVVCPP